MLFHKYTNLILSQTRGRALGTATGNKLDDRGVGLRVPVVRKVFTSLSVTPALGPTRSPFQWIRGGGCIHGSTGAQQ
jgi:hypothetical protein